MDAIWDIARLNQLISSRSEESLNLEYKAAAALDDNNRREITKDISAMANADGGTIIYGIAEDSTHRYLPGKLDPINRTKFTKEWLEHVASNIQPRIESLKIIPVEVPSNTNHVVYVVEVPKATTAHQAQDLKYYRRYNFECQAMPDYQIRELMNRQKFPTLSVSSELHMHGDGGSLHIEIGNTSDVLAKDYVAVIRTPVKWRGRQFVFTGGVSDNFTMKQYKGVTYYQVSFGNASSSPLFPKCEIYRNFLFSWAKFSEPKATLSDVRYVIYADAMPFVKGTFDPDKIIKPA
jgi:hypothetical protein